MLPKHQEDSSEFKGLLLDEVDRRAEERVLRLILAEHPGQLSEAEIALALAGGPPAFDETDSVQRVVCELAGAGLLHRQGELLSPSRPARRFARVIELCARSAAASAPT